MQALFTYLWSQDSAANHKEHEDPRQALKDAIKRAPKIKLKLDGTLEFDDYLVLRCLITRQADRAYMPIKR
jgi:hypothetical protein